MHPLAAISPVAVSSILPPDPRHSDTIIRNATALGAAIADGRNRRVPISLHVVGRILLSELPTSHGWGPGTPDTWAPMTFLVVTNEALVTLWSEEGEGTLDAEGRGRIFVVRHPLLLSVIATPSVELASPSSPHCRVSGRYNTPTCA